MTSSVDIRPDHLEMVQDILREHLPSDVRVWVFGSRASWTTKDSSDLDLALEGEGKIDRKVMGVLADAFEDSDLPYTVDIVDLKRVSEKFRRIVEGQKTSLSSAEGRSSFVDWQRLTLGDVLTLQRGFDLPKTRREPGDYPVIASTGPVGTHKEAMAKGPGVVIGRSGSIGGGQFVGEDYWPLNTTLWVKDFKGNEPRFCYYLLKSLDLTRYNVGSGVPTLNRNHIHPLPVSLPPLIEQCRIARILGTLDDKIELNRRMNATLEGMAWALFKSWFVHFEPVRAKMEGRWRRGESLPGMPADLYDQFPERLVASEVGDVPEGWEVKALGALIDLAYGKALRADRRRGGLIPVYGSNGQVGWHNEKLVDGPGVIVGRKGNPGLVSWSHASFYPIDTTFYVRPIDENLSLYFLLYALNEQNLPSFAADSAVPGLNRNLAYMNRQLLPTAGIIDAFDLQVTAVFAKMCCLEEEVRTLAALRDTLLPRLVSGEILSGI